MMMMMMILLGRMRTKMEVEGYQQIETKKEEKCPTDHRMKYEYYLLLYDSNSTIWLSPAFRQPMMTSIFFYFISFSFGSTRKSEKRKEKKRIEREKGMPWLEVESKLKNIQKLADFD